MDVWRRRTGALAPATITERIALTGDDARVAEVAAVSLAREINVLLGVANDSRDFYTKTARLASATQKLSELQAIVSHHPLIRITGLEEVQAAIARIESELLDFRMEEDGEGTIWVFRAGFFLDTPLEELHYHGIVEHGPKDRLSKIGSSTSRSGWSLALPTFREMGLDIDDPPVYVASAIGAIPAHGGPFLAFLLVFRSIVESGLPASEIELGLNIFSGRDEFTAAVFEKLGPAKLMMKSAGMQ